jgi:hypothetical protein
MLQVILCALCWSQHTRHKCDYSHVSNLFVTPRSEEVERAAAGAAAARDELAMARQSRVQHPPPTDALASATVGLAALFTTLF